MSQDTETRPSRWGFGLLVLAALAAIGRGWIEETPGHFRMFMGASHALWEGAPAYDVPFLGNLFFYSPASALFVYGPFTLFPERVGLLLYLGVSAVIFISGAARFACLQLGNRRASWALAALAPALFSSLVAHKLEVLSTGILLHALAGPQGFGARAGFWIGSITQWKFQTLPAMGLLAVERWLSRRDARGLLAAVGALILWTGLPFLFLQASYLIEQQHLLKLSLNRYSSESFDRFDNLYSFLRFALGIEMTYRTSQLLALAAGAACGLLVVWSIRARRGNPAWLALALGSAYTVLFSPLQQVSAYVLLAPVWIFAIALPERKLKPLEIAGLAFLWAALALGYSELIPEALRQWLRSRSMRTVFAAALAAWAVFRLLVGPRPRSTYAAGAGTAPAGAPR